MKPHNFNGRFGRNVDAQAKTEQLRAALENAVTLHAAHSTLGVSTVEVALERWFTLHSIGNKPRSVDFNKEIVRYLHRHWADAMQKKVNEITDADCVAFASSIAHYSAARYNACINLIRNIIPAAQILPRKAPPIPDHKIPTPEEFDRFLAALDSAWSGRSGLIIRLLAHTGLRMNEARLLKWTDVREDHVYARGDTTKNGRPRTIPFISGTREVLRAMKKFSRGEFVLKQTTCRKAMAYASALTGLPHYGHHTFRHYFATRCIVSGVDIPTVAKWLGHLDGGVVLLKTYCHLLDEHSVAMALRVKLGGYLSNPESLVTLHAQSVTHRARMMPAQSQNKIVEVAFPVTPVLAEGSGQ